MEYRKSTWLSLAILPVLFAACSKDDHTGNMDSPTTITVENILDSKPLVQSGSFENKGSSPVIMPGESMSLYPSVLLKRCKVKLRFYRVITW